MLFLLNDRIVDVALPEMHLERRWRRLGCGEPYGLRADQAVDFVQARLEQSRNLNLPLSEEEACDLAALIIARTGANSFTLRQHRDGQSQPVLQCVPAPVLSAFARGMTSYTAGPRQAWAN